MTVAAIAASTVTSTRPQRLWRNLYRVMPPCVWADSVPADGDIRPGPYVWPTREIAEQKAIEAIAEMIKRGKWGGGEVTYAGSEQEPT